MASVHDVAAALIEQAGPMTAMKLEKLAYYAQGIALATTDDPLFGDEIQAWRNGPVVPELYRRHRGRRNVDRWNGDASALGERERAIVARTVELYGGRDGDWLSTQSHLDEPWRQARGDRKPNESSNDPINLATMKVFYSIVLDDPLVEKSLADPPDALDFLDPAETRAKLSAHIHL